MANEIILSDDISNLDALAKVSQLPIITEQLIKIKPAIEAKVAEVCSLPVTEDTYKDVKKEKANLNKFYSALEDRRKAIKKAVLAPYEEFEKVYNDCVKNAMNGGITEISERITVIEDGLKEQKRAELIAYYNEYAESVNVDFVPFEKANIQVTLSETLKSLKTRAKELLDRVATDTDAITAMPDAAEIMAEYKQTLNLASSIAVVNARHKAIEEEKARAEARAAAEAAEKAREADIDKKVSEALEAPTVAPAVRIEEVKADVMMKATFTAFGTYETLKSIKDFLEERGIKYECC